MPSEPTTSSPVHGKRDAVYQEIERQLLSGTWPVGSTLPTEVDLATMFKCSRGTVNQALTRLAHEGWVERRTRVGTRVLRQSRPSGTPLGLNACAFIYPTDRHAGIWNMVQGFQEEACLDRRRTMMISADTEPEEEVEIIGRLDEFDVRGAVVYPLVTNPEEHVRYCQMLLKCRFPIVLIGVNLVGLGFPAVLGDGFHAGYTMTRHLLNQGLRRIAFVSNSSADAVIRDRFHGYLLAMRESGLPLDDRWTATEPGMRLDLADPLSEATGLAHRLLERTPEVEGIVAGTSFIAMGCIAAARARGLPIPERLRIVSLDDTGPQEEGVVLTRYCVDSREEGRIAYRVLRDRIENRPLTQLEILVQGSLRPGTTS